MSDETLRQASCACGDLNVKLRGDPAYVSTCCCQQCQKRSGGFFGVTAFFEEDQLVSTDGAETIFRRIGESGKPLDFHFCPRCGSTVWWEPHARPGRIAVAAGAFADAAFPSPQRMIWTEHRHPWVMTPDDLPLYDRSPG